MRRFLIGTLLAFYAIASLADDSGHQTKHRPVRVLDANGHVIDDLRTFGGVSGAWVTAGNATTVVPIGRVRDASGFDSATDFGWGATEDVEYTSSDCSGDPIVTPAGGPRPSVVVRQGNDVTVYIAAEGTAQPFASRSLNVPPFGCSQHPQPVTVYGFPVIAKVVVSQGHPEPLRIGF